MFCPLCKAEYRDGFTHCSDCRIPLMPAKQEADAARVVRVWKGGDKYEFDLILDALHDAEIPLHFREHVNVGPAIRAGFWPLLPLGRPKKAFDTEFEVNVLQRDAEHAAQVLRQAIPREDEGAEDEKQHVLRQVLPPPGAECSELEENERPDLAATRYFLAWVVPLCIYAALIFATRRKPALLTNSFIVILLVSLHFSAASGGVWMLYQSARYERRAGRYLLLSFVPFMFIWYSLVRIPLRKEFQGGSPLGH